MSTYSISIYWSFNDTGFRDSVEATYQNYSGNSAIPVLPSPKGPPKVGFRLEQAVFQSSLTVLKIFQSRSSGQPEKARGKGIVHDPGETFGEEVFSASFLLVHLQFSPLCMMYMESTNCFSLGLFIFVLFYPKPSVLAILWNPVDVEKVYICKNKLSQNRSC